MTAQFILLLSFLLVAIYSLRELPSAILPSLFVLFLSTIGVFAILAPDRTSLIANMLGIGRGADLVLYFFIVINVTAVFRCYILLSRMSDRIAVLTRKFAIASAQDTVSQTCTDDELDQQ